jgi:hypothetical protein
MLNEDMDKNTGTYQISFENLNCSNLENIEVGIISNMAMFDDYDEPFSRRLGMNFAGHPLEFKECFIHKFCPYDEDSHEYREFQKFKHFYKLHEKLINSTLTLRFNIKTEALIFFINSEPMEYVYSMLAEYYYPYSFFIYFGENDDDDDDDDDENNDNDNNNNNNSSVRMTRYKHIDTYLDDIFYDVPYPNLPSRIVKSDVKLI